MSSKLRTRSSLVTAVAVAMALAAVLSCSSSPSEGPPAVTILAPTSGQSFARTEMIHVQGSAVDPVDGAITSSTALAWTFDIGGIVDPVGEGTMDNIGPFDAGAYTLTFSATDSRGEKGSAEVGITVH